MMGMPEIADDPRFSNLLAQQQPGNKEAFDALWIPWCLEHTKAEIIERGQASGVLCGPLANIEEVVNDPHWRDRGFFAEIDHPMTGKLTYPGRPIKAEEMPWVIRRPAPLLGQHNEEVYGKMGYSKQDLVRLKGAGII
jgi:crotonobetainyl-CoA:carnitine CoA-transferase CaiB-like acyl-CoA transferase